MQNGTIGYCVFFSQLFEVVSTERFWHYTFSKLSANKGESGWAGACFLLFGPLRCLLGPDFPGFRVAAYYPKCPVTSAICQVPIRPSCFFMAAVRVMYAIFRIRRQSLFCPLNCPFLSTGPEKKVCKTYLRRTQAGPVRAGKQQQEQISPNHVQAIFSTSVCRMDSEKTF